MDPRAGRARGGDTRKFLAGLGGELILYVAHQRKLEQRDKEGYTERQHLQAAARQGSRVAAAELEGPPLPGPCAYVWTWFCELHEARGFSELGPNPISYAEMDAWSRLTGRRLTVLEAHWLRRLDRIWIFGLPKEAS